MKMHDNQAHGPKRRSRPSAESRSISPLHICDMTTPYPRPSLSHQQHAPPTPMNHYPKSRVTNDNSSIQDQPCVGMWQQLMLGASSAVKADSIKCIKYCLSWVQYAMRHIEQQMGILRAFLVSMVTSRSSSVCVLSTVKMEMVDTLRKVVDVISRYTGSSLPHHAKMAIRGFILNLPSRWASLNDFHSPANSPIASSTTTFKDRSKHENQEMAAVRLLNFGQESVDMLQSISGVFSGTEAWLGRLLRLRRQQPLIENSSVHDHPLIQLAPSLHDKHDTW